MLNAIHQLCSNYPHPDTHYYKTPLAIHNLVNNMAKKHLNKELYVTCLSDPFNMVPAASDYSVFVPAVSYIDTEGLDPNADDETLIQQFLDKIKEIPFYKKTKKSSFPKFLQALLIRMCIEYAKDTENAARGLEFTLLHELGHVFHHHSKNHAKLNQKYENGSSKYLNNISLGLLKKIEEIKQSKKHETEADEFAMKTNSRGAIHLFTFLTEFSKQQRKLKKGRILQSLACRVLFSPKGNNRSFYLSHPSEILRLENAKKWAQKTEKNDI